MAKNPRLSVRVDGRDAVKALSGLPIKYGKEAQDILMRVGKIGEEEMRRSIKDAPTPFARIRSRYGLGPPQGRARTFSMYKSVSYMLQAGAKQIRVAVGYLRGKPKDYYYIQDGSDSPTGGFKNKWRFLGFGPGTYGPNAPTGFLFGPATTRITQGTHALRNARELMLKELKKEINKL